MKALNDLIPKYRELHQEHKDGEDAIISQTQADRDFKIEEDRIKASIMSVAGEMKEKEKATVSLAEQMINAELRIKNYNRQLSEMDRLLKLLPSVKDIDVNVRVSGLNSLAQIGSVVGSSTGQSYTTNVSGLSPGMQSWWDDVLASDPGLVLGSYAKGTDYVPKTGLYELHQGEAVIPANINDVMGKVSQAGDGSWWVGGQQIVIGPDGLFHNALGYNKVVQGNLSTLPWDTGSRLTQAQLMAGKSYSELQGSSLYNPSYRKNSTAPAVVAAKSSNKGSGTTTLNNTITITIENRETTAATIATLARQLAPKLDELNRRKRAA